MYKEIIALFGFEDLEDEELIDSDQSDVLEGQTRRREQNSECEEHETGINLLHIEVSFVKSFILS